jgi:hypothetical protein
MRYGYVHAERVAHEQYNHIYSFNFHLASYKVLRIVVVHCFCLNRKAATHVAMLLHVAK